MAASIDTQRLARVLEMLRSSHEGEVVNAARAAYKILTDAGLTWSDLADRANKEPPKRMYEPAPDAPRRPAGRTYTRKADPPQGNRHRMHKGVKASQLVTYCLALPPERFTTWEVNFLRSLDANSVQRYGDKAALTERQWELLWEIGRKVGAISADDAA